MDDPDSMPYFACCIPLYLTFFTLIIASFGARGGTFDDLFQILEILLCFLFAGNQYWFGLRQPPCQFLFGICPCLQLFGNISYSLYSNGNMSSSSTGSSSNSSSSNSQDLSEITLVYISSQSEKNKAKKSDHVVVPALALEMPDQQFNFKICMSTTTQVCFHCTNNYQNSQCHNLPE